jgi:predicted CoA-binding protein
MPRPTIAIIGASPDRAKFGNKAVRAYAGQGYDVYPVNPKGGKIEGLTAYRTLSEVPLQTFDRISVYLPPAIGLAALDDISKKSCGELWLNPGSDSPDVIAKAQSLGLNVVQACSIVDIGVSPSAFGE